MRLFSCFYEKDFDLYLKSSEKTALIENKTSNGNILLSVLRLFMVASGTKRTHEQYEFLSHISKSTNSMKLEQSNQLNN